MFCFPADSERRRRWVVNCRRLNWQPARGSCFCEYHFEESQFENRRADGWRKLRPDAVPTIFNVPNPPKLLGCKRRVLHRDTAVDLHPVISSVVTDHNYAASSKKG